jgi:dUTP pyrophosphatase
MSKYTLFVKMQNDMPEEIKQYYNTAKSNYEGDSGFDLPIINNMNINSITPIDFGISCAMFNNEKNKYCSYYLYPRSSLSKYPLMLANHVGIIDAGYRGNLMAKVRYLAFDNNNESSINIDKGTKLFQICSPDLEPFNVKIVNELPESSRGSNGFGSTGK